MRRRIGIGDLLLSRGQFEYSLINDLGKQTANITIGQLVARCSSLCRELRQGISTRRTIEQTVEVQTADKATHDLKSPQVEAVIAGHLVEGCMVDGGAAVNVMSNWFMDEIGMKPTKPSSLNLKVKDQRCVRSLGIISQLLVSLNGVSVKIDFQVLGISKEKSSYPLILGRPWLRQVKAINYWDRDNMRIGPHPYRVNIQVIPPSSEESDHMSKPENTFDKEYSSWTTDTSTSSDSDTSDSEAEIYAVDMLPQAITKSMAFIEDYDHMPSKEEEILKLVQFGPTLIEEERNELQASVLEFSKLFIKKHSDLPSTSLEEHMIELIKDAKSVRALQRRMAPDKMIILKGELDCLLEGGFITQVKNTEWVSPVVIVPKKGGKWRMCVDYRALNKVTKKDRTPLPFIDELLDSVAGHEQYSFFDGYSGYH
jgi:hypothetical protein